MIDVRAISKVYGQKRAVNNLSFHIRDGEIVGLLGLNGAGKSTILKTLGTLHLATEGEAFIAGYSVRREPEAVREHIGYLPDTPPLYDEMTILRYLEFAGRLKGVNKSHIKSRVDAVLEQTNLTDVKHQRIADLSHGYRQRVNIAQALVHKPKVLILDEPINGLDPVQIVEMRDLILSLKHHHTVILSSHILSEITRTCDRILVIDQGRLVAEGTEEELRGKASRDVEIRVETSGPIQPATGEIEALAGVRSIRQLSPERLHIVSEHDIRPEVARAIVRAGLDLLTLERREAELETLFLKLIRGGADE